MKHINVLNTFGEFTDQELDEMNKELYAIAEAQGRDSSNNYLFILNRESDRIVKEAKKRKLANV